MSEAPALEASALTKRFGDVVAADRLELTVHGGSVHGLLGRNGAGKTTLLRMVLGLLAPDEGTVTLFGEPAAPGDMEARSAVAGFVEEPRFYPYLSARRNLELLARLDGGAAALGPLEALAAVDLAGRSREKVGNFSTGMKQRLGIAAALLRSARLIVLDEPTIGLDPANARSVRTLISRLASQGITVLLSSHNMAEVAEVCDRVTIIDHGRVVWDGDRAELGAAAPAPAYRLVTSDDRHAAELADRASLVVDTRRVEGADVLTVQGGERERDALMLELGRAGVAVRRLEPDTPPLEALFTALTSGGAEEAPAGDENDDEEKDAA